MSIALLPDDRRRFWLQCVKDVPIDQRPVFICHSPTRARRLEWSRLYQEAIEIGKGEGAYRKLFEAISVGVKDWRNYGDKPFSYEALDEVLSPEDPDEWGELALNWMNAFKMSEEERLGFTLPQPSAAEQSVTSVKPAA